MSAIPAPPAGPNPAHGVDAASKGSLLTTPATIKAIGLVVGLIGLGAIGHYIAVGSTRAVPAASTEAAATANPATRPSPAALQSDVSPSPEPGIAPDPLVPSPSASRASVPSRASQLREESQAVLAARQALRSNDAAAALRLLEQARQRFRNGALNEEREALTIEALARTGDKVRAAKQAETFLTAHPRSPHAADVQRHLAQ